MAETNIVKQLQSSKSFKKTEKHWPRQVPEAAGEPGAVSAHLQGDTLISSISVVAQAPDKVPRPPPGPSQPQVVERSESYSCLTDKSPQLTNLKCHQK